MALPVAAPFTSDDPDSGPVRPEVLEGRSSNGSGIGASLVPPAFRPAILHSTDLGSLVTADCLDVLKALPAYSVDLVVTSPPYDSQPKYGNGERYERDWYQGFFLEVTQEVFRVLKPHGSFVLNYRSKRYGSERGLLQYELVFWLRDQGFLFCEDFIWAKPSPPPGRFNRFLKDAVEYCFHFAKTPQWQFFPENCLTPARWDIKDRERRKKLAHNYLRVNEPSGQGRKRVQAGPDFVRPSNVLLYEPEFGPNPTEHPARFPVQLPDFFTRLLTTPGQLVLDPFAGTGTTGLAAESLGRRWLAIELEEKYARVLPDRLAKLPNREDADAPQPDSDLPDATPLRHSGESRNPEAPDQVPAAPPPVTPLPHSGESRNPEAPA